MDPEDTPSPEAEAAEMAEMVTTLGSELGFSKPADEGSDGAPVGKGTAVAADAPGAGGPSADALADGTAPPPSAKAVDGAPSPSLTDPTSTLTDPAKITAAPEAPATWRKEAKAHWAKLDPTVQQEIIKRETDVLRGMGEYKQAADVGKGFQQAVGPYMATIQQQGLNPFALARGHFELHRQLAFGTPAQKWAVVRKLINDFRVPVEGLTSDNPEPISVDPTVKALQDRLEALQSTVTRTTETQAAEAKSRLEVEVTKFSQDPQHPFFDEVAEDIAQLISKGACSTLQEAYDTAVARNPAVRQKSIDTLVKQHSEATTKAAAEAAAKARKSTAANVRSTSKVKSPTAPKGSMDDTLRKAADELFSKAD